MDMYEIIRKNPLLAILRNVPLDRTADYMQAAMDGGVSFFEIALNSPDALSQLTLARNRFGDRCLVGAGTAISVERCKAALDHGAQFLLTPGTPTAVFEFCAENGVPLLPGVLTPKEAAESIGFGYRTMKLFPAGTMPMQYVRDLKTPFDDAHFVAFGGVRADNLQDFFKAGYEGAALCSHLMPAEAAERGDWEECAAHVRMLVSKCRG